MTQQINIAHIDRKAWVVTHNLLNMKYKDISNFKTRHRMEGKIAIILSGGGALGKWEFDCLKIALYNGLNPENVRCITGTSTGTLVGLLLSRGLIEEGTAIFDLTGKTNGLPVTKPRTLRLTDNGLKTNENAIVNTIKRGVNFLNVIFGKSKLGKALFYNALDLIPLMDNRPLVDTILDLLEIEPRWEIPFFFYSVELDTGDLIEFQESDFNNKLDFAKALASSTCIPLLWNPIKEIKTKTRNYYNVVDGGLREGFPVSGAIKRMHNGDSLLGLSCNQEKLKPIDVNNPLQIAERTAVIMMNEALTNDKYELLRRNEIAWEHGEKKGYKFIPHTIIEYSGTHGAMSFSEKAFKDMELTAIEDMKSSQPWSVSSQTTTLPSSGN